LSLLQEWSKVFKVNVRAIRKERKGKDRTDKSILESNRVFLTECLKKVSKEGVWGV
jgi:hypothetical protein